MRYFGEALLVFGCLWLTLSSEAPGGSISWPTEVAFTNGIDVTGLLSGPSSSVVVFDQGDIATLRYAGNTAEYDYEFLRALLQLTPSEFANVDFFAFEGNGDPVGFEATEWVFSDGVDSMNHTNAFGGAGGPVLSDVFLSTADYNTLFGTSSTSPYVAAIAFSLSPYDVDALSPEFSVTISGGGTVSGLEWPDLLAIGVIGETVPEPSALVLLATGALGLLLHVRHRKQVFNGRP